MILVQFVKQVSMGILSVRNSYARCLPWAVRRALEELPESLDETYARILKETKAPN